MIDQLRETIQSLHEQEAKKYLFDVFVRAHMLEKTNITPEEFTQGMLETLNELLHDSKDDHTLQ